MDSVSLKLSDVPKGFCVIRIKDTNNYMHIKDGFLYFYPKMNGCLAISKNTAIIISQYLNEVIDEERPDMEIVDFKDAYNKHGLIEKQVSYN